MSAADLDELLARYDGPAATNQYDEAVTEREHALQAAALAVADGASDELVAAALLHDVGRLLVDDASEDHLRADRTHDTAGARYLARWFGPAVWGPVGGHVVAKRYLCATEPGYREALSPVSERSLVRQGGPMTEAEQEAFRAEPGWADAVALRRWDDRAKAPDLVVPDLEAYRPLLERLAG